MSWMRIHEEREREGGRREGSCVREMRGAREEKSFVSISGCKNSR
jgi:hypothetical protein